MSILNPTRVRPQAWWLAALMAGTSYLCAQTPTVSAPQTTYIYDVQSGNIRRMIGRPGSSFLADSVLTGLQTASVAPNGVSAIAVWSDHVEWVSDLGDYANTRLVLDAAAPQPDQIFWSRDSAAVALFSSPNGTLQFLQRTSGAPLSVTNVDLSALPGRAAMLAVDVEHTVAALRAATRMGRVEVQSLFLAQPGMSPRAVHTPDAPAAAAFAQNGALYIAGRRSTISLVQDPATQARAELLFREENASGAPTAILARSDAGLLYLADAAQQQVRIYDTQSLAKVNQLQLGWQPTRFQPFPSNAYLLNAPTVASEPILLLQTAPQSAVVFIPAGE